MEYTPGPMVDATRETGRRTPCMEKESILGRMVDPIKGTMTWTRSMDGAYTCGRTGGGTRGTGIRVNSMGKAAAG